MQCNTLVHKELGYIMSCHLPPNHRKQSSTALSENCSGQLAARHHYLPSMKKIVGLVMISIPIRFWKKIVISISILKIVTALVFDETLVLNFSLR